MYIHMYEYAYVYWGMGPWGQGNNSSKNASQYIQDICTFEHMTHFMMQSSLAPLEMFM